ncbi:Mucin-like protein [Phytophthora palmivora]|uniref:Mucin-like protein n=1 Tax=Phytophthora palmivora TaxID=4796 RepID=A0A2P4YQ22_9STRA|nr:Mucin-like protein [Phytophthora palmivora]
MGGGVAVVDCADSMRSYLNGECVAPRDSVCLKVTADSWGCVWDDEVIKSGEEATAANEGGTTSSTGTCTDVSVEGDATYCITGAICSGDGDEPAGDRCPVSGDFVAPTDSVCKKIDTGAWGCVWGGGSYAEAYSIDTKANTVETASGGHGLIAASAVAVAIAGVVAIVAIAWSRRKRQNLHRLARESDVTMDPVLTPPASTRTGSFHRV